MTTETAPLTDAESRASDAVYDFLVLQAAKGEPLEALALALIGTGAYALAASDNAGSAARRLRTIADELEAGDLVKSRSMPRLQ